MRLLQHELIEGFSQAGLIKGSSALIHSSLSSFGYVEGGAITVIRALQEVLGTEGTLMVPTLTGKYSDNKENPPIFDVRNTVCWTGKIPETLRVLPDVERSLHPTHSVAAIGGKSKELVSGHENGVSPCDKESPYYKNAMLEGYVILIGVDQESNTSVHCFEEIAKVPYHLQKDITETLITNYSGKKILVRNKLHDWYKPPTDFNKFDKPFEIHGIMKVIKIGNSFIRVMKAKDMLEFAVDLLLKEPTFLL